MNFTLLVHLSAFSYSPGVCSGQGAMCWGSDNLERGTQSVESPRRKLRGASGELQQTSQLLLGEAGHHGPEPLHHLWQQKINISVSALLLGENGNRLSMTYFFSEVPRSSNNNSVGFEVLHIYITGATHQQLKRLKEIIISQWCCKDQWGFIINTHTSNSFSSNMASRFSGTSSFKPAIDQRITLINGRSKISWIGKKNGRLQLC